MRVGLRPSRVRRPIPGGASYAHPRPWRTCPPRASRPARRRARACALQRGRRSDCARQPWLLPPPVRPRWRRRPPPAPAPRPRCRSPLCPRSSPRRAPPRRARMPRPAAPPSWLGAFSSAWRSRPPRLHRSGASPLPRRRWAAGPGAGRRWAARVARRPGTARTTSRVLPAEASRRGPRRRSPHVPCPESPPEAGRGPPRAAPLRCPPPSLPAPE
mmetsp:Transcript_28333/g.83200  ORF Transcript_28333/g.83200 Transcript_28333/m.83200 type:complete len:215 (-) Transcript_28333:87-731(-)